MREWQCTQWNTLLVLVFFLVTFLWEVKGRNKQLIPDKSIMLEKENQNRLSFRSVLRGATWCTFVKTGAINFQRTSHQSKAGLSPTCLHPFLLKELKMQESESGSVASDSFWPHGMVHGILQARILEWVAIPFFRGSSQPSHATQVSSTVGRFLASLATREAQLGNKTLRGDRVDILWGCKISIILLCLGHFFYDEIQIYTHVGDRSAFQTGQWWRICLPMQETLVRSLGWEDTLKKDMATHSSIMQG